MSAIAAGFLVFGVGPLSKAWGTRYLAERNTGSMRPIAEWAVLI